MRGPRPIARLARAFLDAPEDAVEEILGQALSGLTRSELKGLLMALRAEERRRGVRVSVASPADRPAAEGLAPLYRERPLRVSIDPSLGAGIVMAAGDDVVDASVAGMIRAAVDGMKRK